MFLYRDLHPRNWTGAVHPLLLFISQKDAVIKSSNFVTSAFMTCDIVMHLETWQQVFLLVSTKAR